MAGQQRTVDIKLSFEQFDMVPIYELTQRSSQSKAYQLSSPAIECVIQLY